MLKQLLDEPVPKLRNYNLGSSQLQKLHSMHSANCA